MRAVTGGAHLFGEIPPLASPRASLGEEGEGREQYVI